MTYRGDVEETTEAGKISSYKTHDRDPILFNDGFVLSFRNGEIVEGCGDMGHCPNQFCRRNHSDGAPRNGNANGAGPGEDTPRGAAAAGTAGAAASDGAPLERDAGKGGPDPDVTPNVAEYSTLVWMYVWPNTEYDGQAQMHGVHGSSSGGAVDRRAALSERLSDLKALFESGVITEKEHALARRSALGY